MIYFIKMSVFWFICYVFYIVFIQKETHFKTNRTYLLATLFLGLIVPFADLNTINPIDVYGVALPAVTVGGIIDEAAVVSNETSFWNSNLLIWFTVSMSALLTIKFLYGNWRIFNTIRNGDLTKHTNYKLVKADGVTSPFSFMNFIFWNKELPLESEEGKYILKHELAHIQQGHTFDIIFIEILKIVFWWNPLVYLYKNAIRDVHEYLADEAVLARSNKQQYGHLLINQTLMIKSQHSLVLANHFFHSQLKKRINMMTKNKSNNRSVFKYIAFLPVLALLVFACSDAVEETQALTTDVQEKVAQETPSTDVLEMIDTVFTFDPETGKETVQIVKSPIYKVVEQMPVFPGCDETLSGETLKNCAQEKLLEYIYTNIRYPEAAKAEGKEGIVVAQFTVSDYGSILNTKIVRSLGSGCDEEVLKVINSMPKWIPGMQNGKKVNVQFNLPVKFKLS